ncbi:TPA: hypothetical protein JLC61_004098, partial [Escherichia coli]|nr:hypothetical protein [Escherichia coli]
SQQSTTLQSSAAKTVLNRYDLGSHLIGWQIISNFRFWHKADSRAQGSGN